MLRGFAVGVNVNIFQSVCVENMIKLFPTDDTCQVTRRVVFFRCNVMDELTQHVR